MSVVRKQFLICDRCGAKREIAFTEEDPFSIAARPDERRSGWFAPDREHHLCPDCAAVYKAKKAEFDRELKRLAGIRTIEVDI